MRKLARIFFATAFGTFAFASSAAERWDMPSGFPDNNFHTKNIQEFIAKIKQGTKELDFTVHTNQSLFKLQDSKKAVQSGQVPIAELLLVQFGNEDPLYEISAIPFLADDKAKKLWAATKGPLTERLARDGIRLLYGVSWPVQDCRQDPAALPRRLQGREDAHLQSDDRPHGRGDGRDPDEHRVQRDPAGVLDSPRRHDVTPPPQTGVDTQAWDYTQVLR